MPRGDGTGPRGQGPKTGRQMGNCEGAEPIYGRGMGRGFGRGIGRGFGRGIGRGFRNRRYNLSSEDERKYLESEKTAIEKRLKDLE